MIGVQGTKINLLSLIPYKYFIQIFFISQDWSSQILLMSQSFISSNWLVWFVLDFISGTCIIFLFFIKTVVWLLIQFAFQISNWYTSTFRYVKVFFWYRFIRSTWLMPLLSLRLLLLQVIEWKIIHIFIIHPFNHISPIVIPYHTLIMKYFVLFL